MNHSFDIDIAVKYGVNAAILLQHIYFWCQKNEANNHNYHDGSYWTYNSRNAFTVIFPYLSERQIKTALDKLIEDGVIKTGCYNKDPRDRSLWYAVTKKGSCIMQKCSVDYAEMSNANEQNVRPLPDINTDSNTDINTDISISSIDNSLKAFAAFWDVYPRRDAKQDAIKAWKALKPSDELCETIKADIRQRLDEGGAWYKSERRFILLPATYLRGRRWEDEPSTTTPQPSPSPEPMPAFMTHEPHKEYSPDERKAMYREMGFKVD